MDGGETYVFLTVGRTFGVGRIMVATRSEPLNTPKVVPTPNYQKCKTVNRSG